MEAVTPGSSLCTSSMRSPTLISMGRRKKRHFSFLEGSGTSSTKRPYLYFKETSAIEELQPILMQLVFFFFLCKKKCKEHAKQNVCNINVLPSGGASVLQNSTAGLLSKGLS